MVLRCLIYPNAPLHNVSVCSSLVSSVSSSVSIVMSVLQPCIKKIVIIIKYIYIYHVLLGSLKGSCRTFLQQVASGYQIILQLPCLFHKIKSLFLQDVSAPSSAVRKINELSSMTMFIQCQRRHFVPFH